MTEQQTRQRILQQPEWFVETILGDQPWDKQREILRSVRDNPRTTVRSCHASGKSFIAARIALWFLFAHKPAVVLTTAPTARQVEGVLWREIRSAHQKARVELGGRMIQTQYELDNNWFALGLSTNEPDRFQGYHSPNILVIPDESSGIPAPIFEAVEGVLASGNARMLLIGNPTDPTGFFAGSFKSATYNKITISALDTPNFTSFPTWQTLKDSTFTQREQAVTHPSLISPQWAWERLQEWGEDSPMFLARVKGEFPSQADNSLIQLAWIERANRAYSDIIAKSGDEQIGVDVARFGSDKTVFYHRQGNTAWLEAEYGKLDTMEVVGHMVALKRQHPNASFSVDVIGVGAGVYDRAMELEELQTCTYGVNVADRSEVDDKLNLRAELYWSLRDRLAQGELVLKEDDTLTNQLTGLTFKYTSTGRIQIESKEDMKKRGLRSPDRADALVLAYAPLVQPSAFSFA